MCLRRFCIAIHKVGVVALYSGLRLLSVGFHFNMNIKDIGCLGIYYDFGRDVLHVLFGLLDRFFRCGKGIFIRDGMPRLADRKIGDLPLRVSVFGDDDTGIDAVLKFLLSSSAHFPGGFSGSYDHELARTESDLRKCLPDGGTGHGLASGNDKRVAVVVLVSVVLPVLHEYPQEARRYLDGVLFHVFWRSLPYHGMRILKETMLRVPPRLLERWVVARTVENIQPDYEGRDARLFASDDGCWRRMRSVAPGYLSAFTLGGPVGFSCDLTAFSDGDMKRLSDELVVRRKDDAFWARSVGRILCDTPSLVAFQYDDGSLDDVRVVMVTDNLRQAQTTVHPVLANGVDYLVDGQRRSAADLAANGLKLPTSILSGTVLRLTAIRK
mgnify:CR=1 FL=1